MSKIFSLDSSDLNKIYDSYPKVEVYKNVFGLKMLKGGKLNLSRYPF